MKTLAVDLDDTLLSWIKEYENFLVMEGILPHDHLPHRSFNLDDDGWHAQAYVPLFASIGCYAEQVPFEGAIDTLKAFKEAGWRIMILTKREYEDEELNKRVRRDTIKRLKELEVPYDEIHFLHMTDDNKSDYAADLYIDDSPHNIEDLLAHGKNAVVYDFVHNRDLDPAIPRVMNWEEVRKYI